MVLVEKGAGRQPHPIAIVNGPIGVQQVLVEVRRALAITSWNQQTARLLPDNRNVASI